MTPPIPRMPEPEVMDLVDEAQAYADADFTEVNQAFVDRLVEVVGDRPGRRVVDLGTGPGEIPLLAARARSDWHITAVDFSQPMLDLAARAAREASLADRVMFVCGDAKATGLPGGAFDVVFSNSILHHITETDRLWAEVCRLAAPGATVFFRDLARPDSEARARRIVQTYAAEESDLLQEEFFRSLLSAYTVEEVRDQLSRAGLAGLTVSMVTDRHLDVSGQV